MLASLRRVRLEIAACNASGQNRLMTMDSGEWPWPPMYFDSPATKVQHRLEFVHETPTQPKLGRFDLSILRSLGTCLKAGLHRGKLRTGLEDTTCLPGGTAT